MKPVKRFMVAISVVFLTGSMAGLSWAQDSPALTKQIASIRRQYEAIDSPGKKYTVRKHESTYETSNYVYTGYYDGKKLQKIILVSSGEYDQVTTKFYLQAGNVFFIHRITTRFKSLGDNKGVSTEQRFYLAQGKLIRWLGPNDQSKSVDSREARIATQALLASSREATSVLAKSKPQ